jgi:non-heme chloroperoxidase
VQGGQDRITPPEVTRNRLPGPLRRVRHAVIADGPHAIIWTHTDQVNQALPGFVGTLSPTRPFL